MSYISAIIVDFGSTNSGCARIPQENGALFYQKPMFLHATPYYAKDDTWFFVHPRLFERIISNYALINDDDFRICSRLLHHNENPTVIWGKLTIEKHIKRIKEEQWIGFRHFKMRLHHQQDYFINGEAISIKEVIRIFLRILKIECLIYESEVRHRPVNREEIQWGVTIPTIWTDKDKATMSEISADVFGNHVRILSEPEGALVSELVHASAKGNWSLVKGRVSLVIDIGGGTTDITLLEEGESSDYNDEYPLRVLAATDGVGVGGNNIDEDFWNYILRYISKGACNDNQTINYDALDNEELKQKLLSPFIANIENQIIMENAWIEYKHGIHQQFSFPATYRIWLIEQGHSKVANTVMEIMIGLKPMNNDEVFKRAFNPTIQTICQTIQNFVTTNKDVFSCVPNMNYAVKAGGLSLFGKLRDQIDSVIQETGIHCTANMSYTPHSASGSIMDGACIILLNRKAINRFAPCNIYYDLICKLPFIQQAYKKLGVEISLGSLNEKFEEEIKAGANAIKTVIPVAIKGEFFKDHQMPFVPYREDQEQISLTFYGTNSENIVLAPNDSNLILGTTSFQIGRHGSFQITIDFNESPTSNNFRYYITPEDSPEIIDEGNIPIVHN